MTILNFWCLVIPYKINCTMTMPPLLFHMVFATFHPCYSICFLKHFAPVIPYGFCDISPLLFHMVFVTFCPCYSIWLLLHFALVIPYGFCDISCLLFHMVFVTFRACYSICFWDISPMLFHIAIWFCPCYSLAATRVLQYYGFCNTIWRYFYL